METLDGMEMNSLFLLQRHIPDGLVIVLSRNQPFLSHLSWLMSDKRFLKLQGQFHLIFLVFWKCFIFKMSELVFKFLICFKTGLVFIRILEHMDRSNYEEQIYII